MHTSLHHVLVFRGKPRESRGGDGQVRGWRHLADSAGARQARPVLETAPEVQRGRGGALHQRVRGPDGCKSR